MQATHDVRGRGLSGTGFAHDAKNLAGHDLHIHAVDGVNLIRVEDRARTGLEDHVQIAKLDDRSVRINLCIEFLFEGAHRSFSFTSVAVALEASEALRARDSSTGTYTP